MADRKLFYEDPALDRVDTTVVEAGTLEGRPWVRLDATVFYPEGGGQPADRGTIGGVAVVDVRSRGAEVLHLLEHPVTASRVTALLDLDRRFDHRQQHSAQHLLTAILADRHGRATTSFHLGDAYTAIEVEGAPPPPADLRGFEDEANAAIRQDRAVRALWVDSRALDDAAVRSRGLPQGHTGPVRLVEIDGIDRTTCGGTHVARLAEIQWVHLLDAEAARGGTRIRFLAGGRAIRETRRLERIVAQVAARLGTGPDELPSVLDAWQAERKGAERRARDLERRLAGAVAAEIASSGDPVLARFVPDASPELLRAIAAAVLVRRPAAIVVLVGAPEDGAGACFLAQSGPEGPADVREVGEALRRELGARGGGKGRLFQGKEGRLTPGAVERALARD